MLPVLPILFVLGATSFAFIYFWDHIREFLNGTFRNFIQERFGMEWGQHIGMFLAWLDDRVVSARQPAKRFATWFKSHIVMIKTTYTKNNANQVTSRRDIVAGLDNGQFIRRTEEQIIPYLDLPPEIRHEMIRQQTKTAKMDERELIIETIKERAKEENDKELEMSMTS